jgi:tyrosyl-tRNA synthetase
LKSEFLHILQERGFIHQCSDLEGLDAKLSAGPQSAYIGYDPTGPSLHIGHLYTVMMLYWFQQCGHRPITLMGGGTALIPDPTLKDKTRPLLTPQSIAENIEKLKTPLKKFINYGDGPQDGVMVNNYDWLGKLDYIGFLRDVGLHFTINRMLSFDSVKLRLERELPMTFIEFNYMILQGYDFTELHRRYGTILQMGGSDQWGNIINGVELGRKKENLELFGLTAPLLTSADGQKMGKSTGAAAWLNADMTTPYEYYQHWRNSSDQDVGKLLRVYTTLPLDEIYRLEKLAGAEINEAKKILAHTATTLLHGKDAADDAAKTAAATFEHGGMGENLPVLGVKQSDLQTGLALADAYLRLGLCESKGEFRRLVAGGGVRINDQLIDDAGTLITKAMMEQGDIKISAGKKRHAIIRATP